MQRILIVEDEQKQVVTCSRDWLRRLSGRSLIMAAMVSGPRRRDSMTDNTDVMPFLDGWQIISALRESGHEEPVLFLTAKDNVRDKVKGLEFGADDYLIKPFDFTELVARVRTLLRRARLQAATVCTIADMTVDMVRRTVIRSGKKIHFTGKEYVLFELLRNAPEKCYPEFIRPRSGT